VTFIQDFFTAETPAKKKGHAFGQGFINAERLREVLGLFPF